MNALRNSIILKRDKLMHDTCFDEDVMWGCEFRFCAESDELQTPSGQQSHMVVQMGMAFFAVARMQEVHLFDKHV
jgi:hypothetical protein